MVFTVRLLHDFQISRIAYEGDDTLYWIYSDSLVFKFHVEPTDLVKDLVDSFYDTSFGRHRIHHASQIVVFDATRGRLILDQYSSWIDQGVSGDIYVVRCRPAMFKPTPSA